MAKKRTAAFFIAVLAAVLLFSSSFFLGEYGEHDCIGEGCPLCQLLFICERNLKALSAVPCTAASLRERLCFLRVRPERCGAFYAPSSLILLKVKLSN